MATKKISELGDAATPLEGTELAEIVQGGANVKVPVSALGGGGGLADAPSDGSLYARRDGAWESFVPGGGGGGGGGGGWVLHDVWNGAVDADTDAIIFNNLDGYTEVMVVCEALVSASSTISGLWFSDDNGATLLGLGTNSTTRCFAPNGIIQDDNNNVKFTSNSYASFYGMITANGFGTGGPIFGQCVNRAVAYINENTAINAVAVRTRFTVGIPYTGGKAYCWAR